MPTLTFYPLGNADSAFIELDNGINILIDYAHTKSSEEYGDEKVFLPSEIKRKLSCYRRSSIDIVAFTHADEDHTRGAADFFEFNYANKYRSKGRVKINELWVPAAMIVEKGLQGDSRVIRQEARHRLKMGYGIRVFSSPGLLDNWLRREGIDEKIARRCVVISAGNIIPAASLTDGGCVIPEISLKDAGCEIFVHAPFAFRDGDSLQSRNDGSLFLHLTFTTAGKKTRVIMGADTTWDVIEDIIRITRYYGREERLKWDIYRVSHHCSYLSLAPDKGDEITVPSQTIDWLFEQGSDGCYIVSSSHPVPADDVSALPPHRQAANYYKQKACAKGGEFLVTMEYPNMYSPKPMVFNIGAHGAKLEKITSVADLIDVPLAEREVIKIDS